MSKVQKSKVFKADGEKHQVIKKGKKVIVDHTEKKSGKYDKIDLSKHAGAKTVKEGVKAVKDWHGKSSKKK